MLSRQASPLSPPRKFSPRCGRGCFRVRSEFSRGAQRDFREAGDFLEARSPQTASKFFNNVLECYDRLKEFPELGERYMGGTRRLAVTSMPYYLIYSYRDEFLLVLAVAHISREPGYWLDR